MGGAWPPAPWRGATAGGMGAVDAGASGPSTQSNEDEDDDDDDDDDDDEINIHSTSSDDAVSMPSPLLTEHGNEGGLGDDLHR
jgi:hypothetical protein